MSQDPQDPLAKPIDRHAWWFAALAWANGERARLVPLRDLGEPLTSRPGWVLTHSRGLEMGQLGVATIIDMVLRFAPAHLPELFESLSGWRSARNLDAVMRLWGALTPMFTAWAGHIAKPRSVPAARVAQALHIAGEILPFERTGDDEDSQLKMQAASILAYRGQTTHLPKYQLGAFWAASWASSAEMGRLARLSPPLDAAGLFLDVLVLAVVACQRMRRVLSQRNDITPPPDLSIMFTAPTSGFKRPPVAIDPSSTRKSPSSPTSASAVPTPDPAAPPSPDRIDLDTPPESPPDLEDERSSWWIGANDWARGDSLKLERLLEFGELFATRPIWSLISFELKLVDTDRRLRADEESRLALAAFLLEFHRALPTRYDELLDVLVPTTDRLELEHCGRLWMLLDPLFSSWAKTLAGPGIKPRDEARRLYELGDIVPWLDAGSANPEREQRHQIELAYATSKGPSAEAARNGAYWAATWVRNAIAHTRAMDLRGVVPPVSLHRDIALFTTLGALRFRRVLNQAGGSSAPYGPASIPDIHCITTGAYRLRPNR
jgi:hypothetical protein